MMQSLTGEEYNLAQTVHENANCLLTLVNNILDISRLEQGKIVLDDTRFDPVLLANDCYKVMQDAMQRKGLNFELYVDDRIPRAVYGDDNRIKQLLVKLLSNALKFTENGSVTLSANLVSESADAVAIQFSVKDTGIGISAEQQAALFSPFGQLDNSSTRKFGGAGVGLFIAKRLVEMMNGHLDLTSYVGQGSTFSATLVLQRRSACLDVASGTPSLRPSEPISRKLTEGRKVLIVEDNPVLQKLAIKQLKTLGLDAEATMSGIDGVTLASSGHFALVLMDINLPDITGIEATYRIRELEKQLGVAPIPIVAMTAGAMRGDRQAALEAGMNEYLAKPVAIERLKEVIEFFLTHEGENVP
jgi:CheY-like chemotaxis protein